MADLTIQAGDDVLFVVNDAATSAGGKSFRIEKQTSSTVIFQVDEDGSVTLRGTLQFAGPLIFDATVMGDGAAAYFKKSGIQRLVVQRDGGECQLSTPALLDQALVLRAAHDIHVQLDYDDDAETSTFEIQNHASSRRFRVGDDFVTRWYDDAGTQQAEVVMDASNSAFLLGQASDTRGVLKLYRDPSSGDERASTIQLCRESGGGGWLWVDTEGKLRIHSSDPGTSDASVGTVVGTQT